MSMPWFRFFHEALDDPKVQALDGETFKAWVNILCLACRHEGKLPSQQDIAFALRMDNIACGSVLDRLAIAGLIATRKGGANGSYIAPHKWEERQYKSDSSSERVKRYRQRSKKRYETVTETAPDTEQSYPLFSDENKGALLSDESNSDRAFWDGAKAFLGHYRKNPGPIIGKWCRDHERSDVAKAITAAQVERAVDPIPYIERTLRGKAEPDEWVFDSPC